MTLLYFTIQFNMAGGLARIVTDKVNWLVEHGYEVTICNIEPLEVKPYYPLDSRVTLIRGDIQTTPGGVLTRLKGVVRAMRRTFEVIDQVKPDVIVNAHCPLVTWLIPLVRLRCGRRLKLITEMHQSRQGLEVFNRQFMSPTGRWLHRWSIRWIYGRYDRFVVLTHGDQEQWQLKNCVVIPNFVNTSYENDNENQNGKHQIIMLARLMPQKRIDLMVKVWAKLAKDFPDWHVVVLGDGMERSALERQITEAGVQDSFLLPGEVKDVWPELCQSAIMCLTSEYEGFGIVLIEAMQAEVPVMAFEYVGVHDIIDNENTGFIIPFGDIDAYTEKLRGLMISAEERQRLARNAKLSLSKFEKEHVMQKWVDLLSF